MEEPGGLQSMGSLESDTTECLHFDFSLSCIGEGNGNPLQCSCLENPKDGKPGGLPSMGSHSRTRLKWHSSSSSNVCYFMVFGSTSGSTGSQLERNLASGWIILWVSPIWLKWYLEDFKGDAGNRRDLGGWLHGIKVLCMSTRVECMNWMCLFKIHMLRSLGNNQV